MFAEKRLPIFWLLWPTNKTTFAEFYSGSKEFIFKIESGLVCGCRYTPMNAVPSNWRSEERIFIARGDTCSFYVLYSFSYMKTPKKQYALQGQRQWWHHRLFPSFEMSYPYENKILVIGIKFNRIRKGNDRIDPKLVDFLPLPFQIVLWD